MVTEIIDKEGNVDVETELEESKTISRYARQYNLISEEQMNSVKLITVGCGIGGSWATYLCAKMGISNIDVYDFDIVEDANIPSQLFGVNDIGRTKVGALYDRILNDTETEIVTYNEKVDSKTYFDLSGNCIVLNMVDNIESRKVITEKLRDQPVKMIDCRIGGEKGYQIYVVDMMNSEEIEKYLKTLEGEFMDLPCGTKAIIYSSLDEVSQLVNIIKRIAVGEKYPKMINKSVVNFDQIVKW